MLTQKRTLSLTKPVTVGYVVILIKDEVSYFVKFKSLSDGIKDIELMPSFLDLQMKTQFQKRVVRYIQ